MEGFDVNFIRRVVRRLATPKWSEEPLYFGSSGFLPKFSKRTRRGGKVGATLQDKPFRKDAEPPHPGRGL